MQIQIKIIIGTIAFMLTMILLAFVGLREPQRLREYAAAETGRQVENGASIYEANCLDCHGVNGMGVNGGECYDAAGESRGLYRPAAEQCVPGVRHQAGAPRPAAVAGLRSMSTSTARSTPAVPGPACPPGVRTSAARYRTTRSMTLTLYVLNWDNDELCGAPPTPTTVWPDTVTATCRLAIQPAAKRSSWARPAAAATATLKMSQQRHLPLAGQPAEVDGATRKKATRPRTTSTSRFC